jgi:hypothetical protein
MRYFNKHRRGLVKQGYKVGTKATVSTDTDSVVLENPTLMSKLKIQGNIKQKEDGSCGGKIEFWYCDGESDKPLTITQ